MTAIQPCNHCPNCNPCCECGHWFADKPECRASVGKIEPKTTNQEKTHTVHDFVLSEKSVKGDELLPEDYFTVGELCGKCGKGFFQHKRPEYSNSSKNA